MCCIVLWRVRVREGGYIERGGHREKVRETNGKISTLFFSWFPNALRWICGKFLRGGDGRGRWLLLEEGTNGDIGMALICEILGCPKWKVLTSETYVGEEMEKGKEGRNDGKVKSGKGKRNEKRVMGWEMVVLNIAKGDFGLSKRTGRGQK